MAKHSKRRAPRAPFVVTVTAATTVMALAGLPGCESTVTSGCTPGEPCNPPAPDCPDEMPEQGSPCNDHGASCDYLDTRCEYAELYSSAVCEQGTWQVTWGSISCNPPAPACPEEIPSEIEPCGPSGGSPCFYPVDTECGVMDVAAVCVEGSWIVSYPSCEEQLCYQMTTEADCDAMGATCRWLVPGCADPSVPAPPLSEAGCFPSYDCLYGNECPAGTTCETRIYDPCYNDVCDACGSGAFLCVAP